MDDALKSNRSPLKGRIPPLLFAGVLLLELCVFKGEGGWADLDEYLNDTENLWLKGTQLIREDPPQYSRFAPGLPFVAGPFLYLGKALSSVTNGWVNPRGFAVVVIPLAGALAAVFFFKLAAALGVNRRAALWASVLFAFTSPMLTWGQLYFTEVLILCWQFAALWWFFHALETRRSALLFLAGLALGMMPVSHYSMVVSAPALWAGMAFVLLQRDDEPLSGNSARIVWITVAPFCIALLMMAINYSHFGSPLRTGYHQQFSNQMDQFFLLKYIPRNAVNFLRIFWRTPWLALAIPALLLLYRRDRRIGLPVVLALAGQIFFWLCYRDLEVTTTRYLLSVIGLLSLGLPFVAEEIDKRWGRRGLLYSLLLFISYGAYAFMNDQHTRPLFFEFSTGELVSYTWYMSPRTRLVQTGTPVHWPQVVVLLVLFSLGTTLLAIAWKRCDSDAKAPQ